jgi:hypothetical protein
MRNSVKHRDHSRIDLWFSMWIFAWFLLFIVGAPVPSPTFALIIGNIAVIMVIIFFRSRFASYRVEFILTYIICKVIPLFIMVNIEKELNLDPVPTVVLFIIYILYLHLNDRTFAYIYRLDTLLLKNI